MVKLGRYSVNDSPGEYGSCYSRKAARDAKSAVLPHSSKHVTFDKQIKRIQMILCFVVAITAGDLRRTWLLLVIEVNKKPDDAVDQP